MPSTDEKEELMEEEDFRSEEVEEFRSRLLPMPPQKRHPSDHLNERGALMRRVSGGAAQPTIKQLQTHAEKFGGECVVETAAELGYGFDALVRLQDACDRAESALIRKLHPKRPTPRFKSSEDQVKVLLGLDLVESAE